MTGRGRGLSQLNSEVEASYQEYLRQCAQLSKNKDSSLPGDPCMSTSPSSSGSPAPSGSGADAPSQYPPSRSGRGRGLFLNAGQESPLPRIDSPNSSWTGRFSGTNSPSAVLTSASQQPKANIGYDAYNSPSPSHPTLLDEEFVTRFSTLNGSGGGRGNLLGTGRSRNIFRTTGTHYDQSIPGVHVPETEIRGRGRGFSEFLKNVDAPHQSTLPQPQMGVEDFSAVEREVVVRKGDKGLPIPLTANFIRLSVAEGSGLFEYHVDFDPPLESVRARRFILRNHEDVLGKVRTFDGAKLYLPFALPEKVELHSENPNELKQIVRITVRFIKENQMGESIHFYNVLFRRIMEKLGMQEVNRHFYDYRLRYRLPQHRMEIWPGYVTAVDEVEGGLMLCCDVSHRVLRTSTILDVYNDMFLDNCNNLVRLRQLFADYVISQVILTRYNNRHYRIDDIEWDLNPKSTFPLGSSGEEISYVDYYKQQYDITITDLEQPLLVHRPTPKREINQRKNLDFVCLIPECSFMTGLTSEIAKNHKIMKDVSEFTRVPPTARRLALNKYVANIRENTEASEILRSWGLEIEDGGIELYGRTIAPPHIVLNKDLTVVGKIDFTNELVRNPCLEPVAVKDWIIFCTSADKPKANVFMQTYRSVCRSIGINIHTEARVVPVHGGHSRIVENYVTTMMENLKKHVQFVVVIVPSEIGELYAAIKKICCLEKPIPSQVILSKTLGNERQLRSIVSKIALQINCKLGGALWTIRIPLVEKIMFVGMDVYHDPKKRNASVLALVASLNEIQTRYFSRIICQRTHQELCDSLRCIFSDCLHAFRKESGTWPDRIVVFRDGVGDGQLQLMKDTEIVQMHTVLKEIYEDEIPKFTFTIVQKRISCRFYAPEENTKHFKNPPPGTVLDHTVTRRYLFDFFLVSQLVRQRVARVGILQACLRLQALILTSTGAPENHVPLSHLVLACKHSPLQNESVGMLLTKYLRIKGTVTPTHYIVLEDTANVQPDLIQKFAFATSFLYYNWAGPIRVPAVCQYAHKLAFLVGQYVKDTPSNELSSKLYYL